MVNQTAEAMRVLGIILILLGILGFALGGISFTKKEEVADLGALEITKEETRTFPVAPVASGAALVAGVVLLFMGSKTRSDTDRS